MELNQDLVSELQSRVSSRLIAAHHTLEMSSQAPHQDTPSELLVNPALDT